MMAAAAHYALGFDWVPAAVIGTALSPTDPAVMFSVLGEHAPQGRVGTILAAESGANDPVGIALMIGVLSAVQHPGRLPPARARRRRLADAGRASWCGAVGWYDRMLTRVTRRSGRLDPITALAAAGVIYGIARGARRLGLSGRVHRRAADRRQAPSSSGDDGAEFTPSSRRWPSWWCSSRWG